MYLIFFQLAFSVQEPFEFSPILLSAAVQPGKLDMVVTLVEIKRSAYVGIGLDLRGP